MRALGADRAIDYTTTDFTRAGERYDVIVDIVGTHTFQACRRALAPDGTYVLIAHDHQGTVGRRRLGSLPRFAWLMVQTPFSRQLPPLDFTMPDKRVAMAALAELVEAGRLIPHIDRTFPLEQTRGALRYLASGEARGKVLITIADTR